MAMAKAEITFFWKEENYIIVITKARCYSLLYNCAKYTAKYLLIMKKGFSGNIVRIFYFVLDCRSTLSGPGGSFRSYQAADNDMDPRSQYCSWLITIAKSYVVSLSFKELTIPSCDDTFLKIFDGSNDTAPLLGTYCGTNATAEIEIVSSANKLFIVSKRIFSFHAQYNAEHLKGWCTL